MSVEARHHYRFVFLKSDFWQTLRLKVLVNYKGLCYVCHEESISNDAHHIWYPENIWDTRQYHLVPLCRRCHSLIHDLEKQFVFHETTNPHWKKFLFLVAKTKEVLKIPLDKKDLKAIKHLQNVAKAKGVSVAGVHA